MSDVEPASLRCQSLVIEDDVPHHQCLNYANAITFLRIGENCVIMVALCPPHAELATLTGTEMNQDEPGEI